MKKIVGLILIVAICASLGGCGSSNRPSASDPVILTMWHNYGGDMQDTMDELIDQFNTTVGKEQGIIINVSAISSSAELNESLKAIQNGDPGAPDMPDICTAYPNVAIGLQRAGMLVDLGDYFSESEQEAFVADFLEEGRFNGGLYVLPMAKSTEVLYLNRTLFDDFAAATGAEYEKLYTFEGLAELSAAYYEWTDSLTPDVQDDGKAFFAADSWFNLAEVGMMQLGSDIFSGGALNLENDSFEYIFGVLYQAVVSGGMAIYNGYSSDLSKTGDLVCSTGSSAGILFYGDTITYTDGTVIKVDYDILPYPVFENGDKLALQRGGGLIVAASEEKREWAACEFLKWLTAPEQNMRFIESTGYLPVTRQAFEINIAESIETVADARIKKILTAVTDMYESYSFFYAPTFDEFDSLSAEFKNDFLEFMGEAQAAARRGDAAGKDAAYLEFIA